ncbi:MAG: hypothetical protein ACREQI_05415 [Candidatus Binataceae bacterium]
MSKLKEKVEEFAEIAKALPENLQVTCFELLLKNHLEGTAPPAIQHKASVQQSPQPGPFPSIPTTPPAEESAKQEDLKLANLHVKARKFLEKYGVSVDQLNNLYFKEGNDLKPLYEDLKTTKTSESQIRLTLLMALQNAIPTGEFEANIEVVREECTSRVRKNDRFSLRTEVDR